MTQPTHVHSVRLKHFGLRTSSPAGRRCDSEGRVGPDLPGELDHRIEHLAMFAISELK